MTTRLDVVQEALSWIGTRWQHQATVKGVACDCRGLVIGVAVELKLPGAKEALRDRELRGYGRDPNSDALLRACSRYLDPVPLVEARLGDILVMRYDTSYPRHFAILSRRAPDYIVHAYAQTRRVVENILDEAWRARVLAAFSYRGLL